MPPQTETERYDVLRLSNKESNKLTRESIRTALVFLMGQASVYKGYKQD